MSDDDPQEPGDRRPQLLLAQTCLITFAIFIVFLRLFTRFFVLKSLGWDDLAISVGLVTAIAETGMTLSCLNHGAGLKFQSRADQIYTLKIFYAARILYSIAVAAIKFSILLLYLRLFPSVWVRRSTKTLMTLCTGGCSVLLVLWVFKCKPHPEASHLNESSTCVHRGSLFQAHTIFSLFINVLIIALPMWTLWKLHMPLRRRLLVMGIFAVGFIPCVTLIARLAIFTQSGVFEADPTWWISQTENWVLTEYCSGLICASLIHLKPLINMLFPSLLADSREQTKDVERALPTFKPGSYAQLSRHFGRKYGYVSRPWTSASMRSNACGGTTESNGMIKVTTELELEDDRYFQPRAPDRVVTLPLKHCDTLSGGNPEAKLLRQTGSI